MKSYISRKLPLATRTTLRTAVWRSDAGVIERSFPAQLLVQDAHEPVARARPARVVLRRDLGREYLIDGVARGDLLSHSVAHHDQHVVERLQPRLVGERAMTRDHLRAGVDHGQDPLDARDEPMNRAT